MRHDQPAAGGLAYDGAPPDHRGLGPRSPLAPRGVLGQRRRQVPGPAASRARVPGRCRREIHPGPAHGRRQRAALHLGRDQVADQRAARRGTLQGSRGRPEGRSPLRHRSSPLRGRAAPDRGGAEPAPGRGSPGAGHRRARHRAARERAGARASLSRAGGKGADRARAIRHAQHEHGGHGSDGRGRQSGGRERPRGAPGGAGQRRQRPAPARLHDDPRADRRAYGQPARPERQHPEGQRRQSHRRDQSDPSDLRVVRGARAAPGRHQEVPGGRHAQARPETAAPAADARDRPAHVREQHRGPDHRDHPAQGDVRDPGQRALPGPVRDRADGAHEPHGDRGALAGDPAGSARPLRLRRETGPDGRDATDHARRAAGGRDDRRERPEAVGARCNRRPAPAGAGLPNRGPPAQGVMNTELFIRRPVLTTLLMGAILLFGIMGFRLLPVSDLPNIDFPTIQVAAALPGASPETMASAVATPLEKQFTTIAGIDSMTSASALGLTQITIQFSLDRNIDAAAQDVQAMIAKSAPLLPPGMPTPPTYQKVNPADQPVLYLALSSPTLPLYTVDEYAQTNLAQRISTITGVAQVQVFGSHKYAVRVQLDPRALTTRGIGLDEVEQALARSNVNMPTGTLFGSHQMFSVQATGQLQDAAAFRPLIVAYRNGSPVRLEELGRVVHRLQADKGASWYNDERAGILAIQRQPGHNSAEGG